MIDQSFFPRLATYIRSKNWMIVRTIWTNLKSADDLDRLEKLKTKLPIGLEIQRSKNGLAFYENGLLTAEIKI